jgi:hypothetical protein
VTTNLEILIIGKKTFFEILIIGKKTFFEILIIGKKTFFEITNFCGENTYLKKKYCFMAETREEC